MDNRQLMAIGFYALLAGSTPAAAMPAWAKFNTQQLSGSIFRVVCSGEGPSIDLARREAEQGCKASAASKLTTDGHVKAVTVETEHDVGFHQEVTEQVHYLNLGCTPEREEVEGGDGQYTVWLRCRFDLSKAKVADTDDEPEYKAAGTTSVVPSSHQKAQLKVHQNQTSESMSLSISTVPQCDDLLISGAKPRVVRCDSNPVNVVVEPGDTKALIRAKGYQPSTVELQTGGRSHDAVQIIMEPN